MCSFAEGLLEGTALHYGELLRIEQHECMKRGDPRCVLDIAFTPRPADA
jgi:predicted hydrocarbon binding protein